MDYYGDEDAWVETVMTGFATVGAVLGMVCAALGLWPAEEGPVMLEWDSAVDILLGVAYVVFVGGSSGAIAGGTFGVVVFSAVGVVCLVVVAPFRLWKRARHRWSPVDRSPRGSQLP